MNHIKNIWKRFEAKHSALAKWLYQIFYFVIFLVMTVFFGIMGLAGWILSYIWPVLLVMLAVWMFRGPRR